MRFLKKLIQFSLTLTLTALPAFSSLAGSQDLSVLTHLASATVYPFDIGPGVVNLSLGDQFANYQWALKNDGNLQLVSLINKFPEMEANIGTTPDDTAGSIDTPERIGPGAFEPVTTNATAGIDINIRPAWELYSAAQNKRQVTVAVIDTGVDINHQELQGALWVNADETPGDGIDNDGNGFIDDTNGWNFYDNNNSLYTGTLDYHGTHAAGIIAAARGTHGIAGIADNSFVKIMPLKALGGETGQGSTENVMKAIQYAEANGANICNLSFGANISDPQLEEIMKNSRMLFVVAAGNGDPRGVGYDIDKSRMYPAALPYDNIISVANLMFDGNLSSDSNFGVESVDIAAPGSYIVSTTPENTYAFMSGTSMAAPMVTGVAAMLYSYRPDIRLLDVKNSIINTARKLDSLSGKVLSGGMLDANAALTYQ